MFEITYKETKNAYIFTVHNEEDIYSVPFTFEKVSKKDKIEIYNRALEHISDFINKNI